MTLKECYDAMGADYDKAITYLRSEKLLSKYVLKFLDDKSYELLCTSFANEDWGESFRAAHTIKGISQNLSFTKLIDSASALTESLRGGECSDASPALFEVLKADYAAAVGAIALLDA